MKNADKSKISYKKNFKTIYKQGIEHIINQSENGNADTTIHSYFPNSDGFKFKDRYSDGDVFQRAIIIDCLHDIPEDYISDLSPFFEKETDYLCSQERLDGGWNFYKDLEYQPNDLDTTAQVIQAIFKMNRQNIISKETICAIDMMLKQQNKSNGRIGTWILPTKERRDQYKEKQYQFIKNYAGHDLDNSVDIDVMANFIYALFLIDSRRYKNEIELGIDFIENGQNKNGSWSSTWYWGDYYCTYVCLRLLCELRQKSKTVEKARDFILTSQNINQAWGYKESVNDPLNTAYALISLHYFKALNFKVPPEKIKPACSYLKQALNNPNEMNKSDFINLRKKKYSAYRSNSVTIAFGLRALSLWQNSTLN